MGPHPSGCGFFGFSPMVAIEKRRKLCKFAV